MHIGISVSYNKHCLLADIANVICCQAIVVGVVFMVSSSLKHTAHIWR